MAATAGDGTLTGEIHGVIAELRDRGLVPSFDRVVSQVRGDPRASAVDVLVESHPDHDDGGAYSADLRGLGRNPEKVATHLGALIDGGKVASIARITFYGACSERDHRKVGVLSLVGTAKSKRRRGLATRLLKKIIGLYPDADIRLSVAAENTAAVSCYMKLGFVRNGRASGGYIPLSVPR